MSSRSISYDWLEEAILSVCRPTFTDPRLSVVGLAPRPQRVFAHHEYAFTLRSPDADLNLVLRLQHGRFSIWNGIDPIKITKEYSAMRHTYKNGFPTPFPYAYSPSRNPFGYPYILMDAGDGRFWWESEASFSRQQEEVVDAYAERLAQLHADPLPQHPLIPRIYLSDVIQNLRQRTVGLNNEELDACLEACAHRFSEMEPMRPTLLHGRLDLDALLLHHGNIRAITHWEFTAIGDPRWDAAYASLSLQYLRGRALANRFIARYVEASGNPLPCLDEWEGLVALRDYGWSLWLRSLDAKGFHHVAGLQTTLFDQEDWRRQRALHQFVMAGDW